GNIFGRFTGPARRAVVEAEAEARAARHDHVASEHIVLGLLRVPECLAVKAIEESGASPDAVPSAGVGLPGPPREPIPPHIPCTPDSKRVLDLTAGEALRLGHDAISTGHMLLGVLANEEGLGAQALVTAGVTKAQVEAAVGAALADGQHGE